MLTENQRWVAMASSNACIKLSCIKLNSADHQISFGFAIFPFHDHIKNNLVHLAINKLTLSLRYSHLMNTAITKHHCSIPLSIEKLTFHLLHWSMMRTQSFSTSLSSAKFSSSSPMMPIVDNAATTFQLLIAVNYTEQSQ